LFPIALAAEWLETKMKITSDWHIHSRNSCDDASLAVDNLVLEAAGKGILDFGLTDHIHTPFNLPDLANSRAEYEKSSPGPRFHFGVEVSCVSQWEVNEIATGRYKDPTYGLRQSGPAGGPLTVCITENDIKTFGIEYVIGGTHWPMYVPKERTAVIADYHRQNMFLATHPLIDIVAHPWWWMEHWHWIGRDGVFHAEPWFDDFGRIPAAMHAEFASAAVENGKKVEINFMGILFNPQYPQRFIRQYLEYLAGLKERGVALCIGSDCHDPHYNIDFETAGNLLTSVGIEERDIWVLEPRLFPQQPAQ
jgi:histidinol phosphatase-like PHP family hydrolase